VPGVLDARPVRKEKVQGNDRPVMATPSLLRQSFYPFSFGKPAAVAQLVEHLLGKEEVMGSSPISSSEVEAC
jgi:hypothetical protein